MFTSTFPSRLPNNFTNNISTNLSLTSRSSGCTQCRGALGRLCSTELPPANQQAIEALKAIAIAINSEYPEQCKQIGMTMLKLHLAQLQSYAADQQALVDMSQVIANTITTPDIEQPAGLFREVNFAPTPQ